MQMTPDNWDRAKELFAAALELSPSQRVSFLTENCREEGLRLHVEKLLNNYQEAGSFLDDPVLNSRIRVPNAPSEIQTEEASSRHLQLGNLLATAISPEAEDPMVGRHLGAYKLVRRVGEGGMAAVFLAVRADDEYRKQVAIKVVPPGLDSGELLRRFRNERQTLASLDHPNIVKLLDGGSTPEGLPFLVMDYVEGSPIDEYCDQHKLTIDKRLHLFGKVCEAVLYAHQKLVIHRDLKPSNIMVVADGTPRLLDFGIAKVLNPDSSGQRLPVTQTGTRCMTPAYASPEQMRGKPVTLATDIYSLGVVLYELLTGHRPYRLTQHTPAEMERAICEQEPEPPSMVISRVERDTSSDGKPITKTPELVSQTREEQPDKLRRRLRGDLDNIVLKVLQKEPQRRYASVEELCCDLQRHLEHLPVRARRSTLRYRTAKFVRRHKTEVIAGVLMSLVLFGAIGFERWDSRRAAERAQAELASLRSKGRRSIAVLGFKNLSGRSETAWLSTALSEMLTTELAAGEKLRTISAEDVAQTKINLSLPDTDSLAQGTLRRVRKNLGSDFVVLGSYLDLGGKIRLDLRVQDAVVAETIAAVAQSGTEADLPDLISRAGVELRNRLGAGEVPLSESAKVKASLPTNPEAVRLYAEGLAKLRVFDALGARSLLEKAVAANPVFALAHSGLADAWATLGYDLKAREEAQKAFNLAGGLPRQESLLIEGRYREAAKEWGQAIEIYRTLFNFFPDSLDYGLRLAVAQVAAGKGNDALTTVAALGKLSSPDGDDPRINLAEAVAAGSLSDFKRQSSAAAQAAQKGEATGARLVVAQARIQEVNAFRNLGDPEKANAASYQARQLFATAGDRFGEARSLHDIGAILLDQGNLENATKAFQESLVIRRQVGDRAGEAAELTSIGAVLAAQKDIAGAKEAYERSLAVFREVGDKSAMGNILNQMGTLEFDTGDMADAKAHLQESAALELEIGNQSAYAGALSSLAQAVWTEGDPLAATKMLEECLGIWRRSGQKNGIGTALLELADVRHSLGDLSAAQKLYSDALQVFTESGNQRAIAYALHNLGRIALAEANLTGARKEYDEALAIREKVADKGFITDTKLRLGELSLEEGRAAEAESAIRMAVQDYRGHKDPDNVALAESILVRSLLAQKKLTEAEEVVGDARMLATKSADRASRQAVAIADARVLAAVGKTSEATKLLRDALQEAGKGQYASLEFEARLVRGETEISSGNLAAARAELKTLERDANAKGFVLIARKAAAARMR